MAPPDSPLRPRIRANLEEVRERIAVAAEDSGRRPDEVRLIVVTKGRSLDEVRAVLAEGVTDIGENRVQEGADKWKALAEAVRDRPSDSPPTLPVFHLVGHLQRNKVAKACGFVDFLHSLDSLELARTIAARAKVGDQDSVSTEKVGHQGSGPKARARAGRQGSDPREKAGEQGSGPGCPMRTLVQVNITGEPQKHGIRPEEAPRFVEEVIRAGLRPVGLMCMSRLGASPDEHRRYFERLALIRDRLQKEIDDSIAELSMGMTDDFEEAIKAGATMVRIGRAIFGPAPHAGG